MFMSKGIGSGVRRAGVGVVVEVEVNTTTNNEHLSGALSRDKLD